jgi:hypothetical protein
LVGSLGVIVICWCQDFRVWVNSKEIAASPNLLVLPGADHDLRGRPTPGKSRRGRPGLASGQQGTREVSSTETKTNQLDLLLPRFLTVVVDLAVQGDVHEVWRAHLHPYV